MAVGGMNLVPVGVGEAVGVPGSSVSVGSGTEVVATGSGGVEISSVAVAVGSFPGAF